MKQVRSDTGIVHFRTAGAGSLQEFLLKSDLEPLPITPDNDLVKYWMHMGCVYVDGLRCREDRQLQAGQVIRLHTKPKFYTSANLNLKDRIVLEETEFLVLDKPPGLPTHATLDNYVENAQYILEAELGIPIYVTHRLDIPTEGLLILAKTKSGQALINKVFSRGLVTKIYNAFTEGPLALGEHCHFIDPKSRTPKVTHQQHQEGWWECRLKVEESSAHPLGFKNRIHLLTGKTHQIRAQLKALNQPVIGDKEYGSKVAYKNGAGIALECSELHFPFRQTNVVCLREAGSI